MQNQIRTWKEILKKKKTNRATAFYLVSSIQYEVSDTMHVTKWGTEKKQAQKNNLMHIHTML